MLHSYLTLKIKRLIFDSLKQADDSLDFAHSTLQHFPGNFGLKIFHSIALSWYTGRKNSVSTIRRSLIISKRDWTASLHFAFDNVQVINRSVISHKSQ